MPERKGKNNSEPVANSVLVEAGKFCLDIAKLVFGGVILAGLMKQDMDYMLLFLVGLGVVLLFIGMGFYMLTKSKKLK